MTTQEQTEAYRKIMGSIKNIVQRDHGQEGLNAMERILEEIQKPIERPTTREPSKNYSEDRAYAIAKKMMDELAEEYRKK